jgi:hypothetical protein
MDKFKKLGNLEQIASTRRVEYKNGKADGVKAIICRNDGLSLSLLENSTLDIFELSFEGINMSFISKNGLVSRSLANTHAYDFVRSFSGGFLFTCGLDNIGKPEGDKLLHGNISSLPAKITKEQTIIENGEVVLEIEGEMYDTALFSKNIAIIRNYRIYSEKIILTDKIVNRGYQEEKIIILYHFNLGYPMLDSCSKFSGNIATTQPRTENCVTDKYQIMSEPADICFEEVFIHTIDGEKASLSLENPELRKKVKFSYDTRLLKFLAEWKSMQSGDYVLGIEPATSHLDNKKFIPLKSGESLENKITIEFCNI